jgi:hypothetical protein
MGFEHQAGHPGQRRTELTSAIRLVNDDSPVIKLDPRLYDQSYYPFEGGLNARGAKGSSVLFEGVKGRFWPGYFEIFSMAPPGTGTSVPMT